MTYCLAMRLEEGLVFLSDSRTNAGVDNVSTYRKLHVFRPGPDRIFVLQSAGNLGTTQEVLDRLARDLLDPNAAISLASAERMFEVALYVGSLTVEVAASHRHTLGDAAAATFILGGQIAGHDADIFLVYPEGNCVRASEDRPFLQIGETKYGKSLLDLAVRANADLIQAAKIALSSMTSTAMANLSVGPPYDLGIYRNRSFSLDHVRVAGESPYLARLEAVWTKSLLAAVAALPEVEPGDIAELRDELTGTGASADEPDHMESPP
ncbi:MAG: hypothetical protein OEW30_00510 [Acidimicrobiia bacterium]|nr:hypothetical protein [Acidimicrobiia bacterium]MDH5293042.1 hypothetical protein [Acidimicrobiia bacterium]